MSCCGNRKDVKKEPKVSEVKQPVRQSSAVKARKTFDANDQIQQADVTRGFSPIRRAPVGSYAKQTKDENYGQEYPVAAKSHQIAQSKQLQFKLDDEHGVANTFDIPTFDYTTMLSHNIYFNLNQRERIVIDDGNASKFVASR